MRVHRAGTTEHRNEWQQVVSMRGDSKGSPARQKRLLPNGASNLNSYNLRKNLLDRMRCNALTKAFLPDSHLPPTHRVEFSQLRCGLRWCGAKQLGGKLRVVFGSLKSNIVWVVTCVHQRVRLSNACARPGGEGGGKGNCDSRLAIRKSIGQTKCNG